jgi:sugar lactone lactonase YvrE
MIKPQPLVRSQNRLGETPIWDPDDQALYWVDWGGLPTCRYHPSTGEFKTFPVDLPVTALARRVACGWIAIAQHGLYEWDPCVNIYTAFAGLSVPDNPDYWYNDAAIDRQGRLLVGTFNSKDPFAPEGSLYRLEPGESLVELDRGYATANGIGISPDGGTLYVSDQRHRQIIALDYDASSGEVSNRRIFAQVPEDQGMPDGITVDAEGFIWSGHWDGWRLTRYDPDGKIECQILFPVQHVISCAFGGPNLDELFVTTASWGFSDADRQEQPHAGDLFCLDANVKGLVEPAFAGQLIPGVYSGDYPRLSRNNTRR